MVERLELVWEGEFRGSRQRDQRSVVFMNILKIFISFLKFLNEIILKGDRQTFYLCLRCFLGMHVSLVPTLVSP